MSEDRTRLEDYEDRDSLIDSPADRDDEAKTSDEIKADIEQTRQEMSDKINLLQERFDPSRLKEQAQETVRTIVTDSTDSLLSYVRTSSGELAPAVVDIIKRNPIPALLVGVGVGLIVLETLNRGTPAQDDQPRYAADDGFGRQSSLSADRSGVRAYPVAGSIGMGSTAPNQGADQLTETNVQAAYVSGYVAGETDKEQGGLQGAVDQVREKASELGSQVQEKAAEAGSYVRDKVQQWTGQERNQWDSRQAPQRSRADYRPRRRGGARRGRLQRNPMSFGLATLAVGALFGLALPASKTENRLLGETRNQLFDSAQTVAQDVKQRVQQVVDTAAADLQQTAQQTADQVKQTVKDAASDINHMNERTATRSS